MKPLLASAESSRTMGLCQAGPAPLETGLRRWQDPRVEPCLPTRGSAVRTRHPIVALLVAFLAAAHPALAQHYQTDFPPDEFRARWARLFDRIGADAVAIVQGAGLARGFVYPRQTNEFYYLSGIETAHSYILLDGRSKTVTLYLPPRNERLERSEGRVLSADDGELVKRLTGADEVRSTAELGGTDWPASLGRVAAVYTPFAPAEGQGESRGELRAANAAILNDPWDGRLPREARVIELLRARFPRAEIRDLTPILDALRSVKSPREVALIRRASQIAGLGMMEAIRSTEASVWEYQLDAAARYVFLVNGARLEGYRSITASGTENINNGHYFMNTRQIQDDDLVLMDFAPDYRYYTSDIGRMWPVSATYLPWQRELLSFVLRYRNEILARIRPGVSSQQIYDEMKTVMMPVVEQTTWSKPIYEDAARKMVETGGGTLSHPVGMAVHDVGGYRDRLRPGHVFSVDPQLRVPDEQLYIRYEDTGVVTETGFENFTGFLPAELDDLETLTREKGVVQTTGVDAGRR